MSIKVLVVGGGGREHALAWKIRQSPHCGQLFCAPGNAGTAEIATNLNCGADDINDIKRLLEMAIAHNIGLTVIGPEDPLNLDIVSAFQARGLRIFGPTKAAARIEASKSQAKRLMLTSDIPTARFRVFDNADTAKSYVQQEAVFPCVVKADGPALGKGVFPCFTQAEALEAIEALMVERRFQESGDTIVIEDFVTGPECSAHAICSGDSFITLPLTMDHKRAFTGDLGPNTGGMGAIGPIPWGSPDLDHDVRERIIKPALAGMSACGTPFSGCLFPGLICTSTGPKVLEFNARFGDPETQVLMRLFESDLLELLYAAACGDELHEPDWYNGYAACVVLAADSYGCPGKSIKRGHLITGIDEAEKIREVQVFHAGTQTSTSGPTTNGGRVLGITTRAPNLESAIDRAYRALGVIHFEGAWCRQDIGKTSLELAHKARHATLAS